MVYALTDSIDRLQAELGIFLTSMMRLTTVDCGISVTELNKDYVQSAFNIYGQNLGVEVITQAFKKLGL